MLGARVSVALIVDTAIDDLAVFGRAALLIGAGVVLWALNRALAR